MFAAKQIGRLESIGSRPRFKTKPIGPLNQGDDKNVFRNKANGDHPPWESMKVSKKWSETRSKQSHLDPVSRFFLTLYRHFLVKTILIETQPCGADGAVGSQDWGLER